MTAPPSRTLIPTHKPPCTAVPGYDPEDAEETVRKRLDGGDPGELLDEEERRAYEPGEDLLEALDSDTLESLVVGDESPDA